MSKTKFNPDDCTENVLIGILMKCTEHLINPELAEKSWDNPYTKEEAIEILEQCFLSDYTKSYVRELFKPLKS